MQKSLLSQLLGLAGSEMKLRMGLSLMKSLVPVALASLALVSLGAERASAQSSSRYLLFEGSGEWAWSVKRPSPINGEAEGRVLALRDLNGTLDTMANIQQFEQFSRQQVVNSLQNKFEKIGELMKNTTTFSRDENSAAAFRANRRGVVVTVSERGFKPGTFSSVSVSTQNQPVIGR